MTIQETLKASKSWAEVCLESYRSIMKTEEMLREAREARKEIERMSKRTNGAIFWKGFSPVDGAPIALIATGFKSKSKNSKTGRMIQTWIMRTDIRPDYAVRDRLDVSICGNCPHRANPSTGVRTCYVTVFRAPLQVFKAFERGNYTDLSQDPGQVATWLEESGMPVRWGSYGDPAMVPVGLLKFWSKFVPNWTGYTHQKHEPFFNSEYLDILMESREGEFDPSGARSFRVISDVSQKHSGEVLCPATPEGGSKTSCASCGLCKGASLQGKSVAILVHGIQKKKFVPLNVLN